MAAEAQGTSRRILIDPVTRIEGHAKISIFLDDAGAVSDVRFHVTEFRGFEDFCVGRPVWEMPSLTARTCGICPVSHLMAGAKAGDAILAVPIPETAAKLRRVMNLGQIIQSHALSFFHLSAPDLLLGFDSEPARRNIFGLMQDDPELARRGIRLRKFGQEVIARLGGQRIHAPWTVPGGVNAALGKETQQAILADLPEAQESARIALDLFKGILDRHHEEMASFGSFDSLFIGLIDPEGNWEHYDGKLRVGDNQGKVLAEFEPADYRDYIGEATERNSYLKSPYYRPLTDESQPVTTEIEGVYRVGPLARLNLCERIGVPLADQELLEYRERAGGLARSSFLYHYARLIEILAATEWIERHLHEPDILSKRVRADAGINRLHGVGVSEAPRGTLFHDYEVDEDGLITKVNLIIATGQNNLAINRTVKQIAQHFIKAGQDIQEGMLNRIEAGIRAFDPCLSCSTHALGQMPLKIQIHAATGDLVREIVRD